LTSATEITATEDAEWQNILRKSIITPRRATTTRPRIAIIRPSTTTPAANTIRPSTTPPPPKEHSKLAHKHSDTAHTQSLK
jgi:hypothetical protein